jgi:hypothetical protein
LKDTLLVLFNRAARRRGKERRGKDAARCSRRETTKRDQ